MHLISTPDTIFFFLNARSHLLKSSCGVYALMVRSRKVFFMHIKIQNYLILSTEYWLLTFIIIWSDWLDSILTQKIFGIKKDELDFDLTISLLFYSIDMANEREKRNLWNPLTLSVPLLGIGEADKGNERWSDHF